MIFSICCFDELYARLTMESFAEKPIEIWPLLHFVRTELEANRGVSGGGSHNSMQFVMVKKLQKLSWSRNCRNRMQCFNLGASLRQG